MEGVERARRRAPGSWSYVVVPVVVVGLLVVCYVDSVLPPPGLLGALVPDSLGFGLVTRSAEAGTAPGMEPVAPIPEPVRSLLDIGAAEPEGGELVQVLDTGERVVYTLDAELQDDALGIIEKGDLQMGALVLVDSRTGRILAAAGEGDPLTPSGDEPGEGDRVPPVFSSEAPAASVFKVVTGAALVESAGLAPDDEVCYWGGSQKLKLANLVDDPDKDKSCATLGFALGKSINAVFAKLADRHLDPQILGQVAGNFGFGESLPIDYPVRPEESTLDIPTDRLEFARTAAGFWHVHLSPLHGAFIAQSVAQAGAMLRPLLVDEIRGADGEVLWKAEPRWYRRTVAKETAGKLTTMMAMTTTKGTARKYFKDPQGNPYLPGITVAGKTGTLTRSTPYRGYTWFVGFAPADEPEVAVAALAVNAPQWKVKAATMARDILRAYFKKKKKDGGSEATSAAP
jgi:cell division protein FtsI/penicillin-binding protein 2